MKTLLIDSKLFLVLTLLSSLLIFFDHFSLLNLPKSLIQQVTVPIEYGLYQSGVFWRKQFEFIVLIRRAAQENHALRLQAGELLTENAQLRGQLSETQTLVDQYNKLSPKTYDLLPARVISTGRFLMIDKGLNDGVKVGQAVVYKDNFVGQIKQVSPRSSEVLLEYDPDSKIAVFSQNTDGKAKGMLSGQYGSELLMDKILHQEIIVKDDLVYSEGIEGALPKGLIMGRVSEVLERQNEVFKQAKIELIFDLADLGLVFVIRNP